MYDSRSIMTLVYLVCALCNDIHWWRRCVWCILILAHTWTPLGSLFWTRCDRSLCIKRLPHGRGVFSDCWVDHPGDWTNWTLRCTLRARKHTIRCTIWAQWFGVWSLDEEDRDYLGFLLAVLFQAVGVVWRAFGGSITAVIEAPW